MIPGFSAFQKSSDKYLILLTITEMKEIRCNDFLFEKNIAIFTFLEIEHLHNRVDFDKQIYLQSA